MKKKKLNRDGWGFQYFPYYQMRVDCGCFHGLVCYIKIVEGQYQYWDTPVAGHVAVCGEGMSWLQLIPDGQNRLITTMYFRDNTVDEFRNNYPEWARKEMCPSAWYVDVMEGYDYDEDGIVVYTDKYLDVIFFPEGEISISDRDELDEAYANGELTKEQYESGVAEGDAIVKELCGDIPATAHMCAEVRRIVDERIAEGYKPMFLYHGSRNRFERLEPQQAHGECGKEAMYAVYAGESLRDVIPFAVPIRPYPDTPEGSYSFSCDAGWMKVEYGYVDPNRSGYVYRLKSDTFRKIDEWEWVSEASVVPVEIREIPGRDMMHKVSFSDKAREIQKEMFPNTEGKF